MYIPKNIATSLDCSEDLPVHVSKPTDILQAKSKTEVITFLKNTSLSQIEECFALLSDDFKDEPDIVETAVILSEKGMKKILESTSESLLIDVAFNVNLVSKKLKHEIEKIDIPVIITQTPLATLLKQHPRREQLKKIVHLSPGS